MSNDLRKVIIEVDRFSKIEDITYHLWDQANPEEPFGAGEFVGQTRKALDLFEDQLQLSIHLYNDEQREDAPSLKTPPYTEETPLAANLHEWVKMAVSVHGVSGWKLVTGVSEERIQAWLDGKALPQARDLWDLLTVSKRYHPRLLSDFDRLADMAFAEVLGPYPPPVDDEKRGPFRTLGQYVHTFRYVDLQMHIEALPFRTGFDLMERFVAAGTREMLRDHEP